MASEKALVLLSGGLDSTTTLAIAISDGYEASAISFQYGQQHSKELESAKAVVLHYALSHHAIIELDLTQIGGSSLTEDKNPIAENRSLSEIGRDIPDTYVPARNTIFLSIASALAEVHLIDHLFIGANSLDYSGYPDCRPEYYQAMQEVIRLGTKRGVEGNPITLHHPLIEMTKAEIIARGADLKVPYHLTWSCYKGGKRSCGRCDSCILRRNGFQEAGIEDPLEYDR